MAEKFDYDVVVIGSGPGGEGAAMKAAKSGKRVAMIEDKPLVGGNCTHRATIPSKALRQSIQMLADTGSFKEQDYQSPPGCTHGTLSEMIRLSRGRLNSHGSTPRSAS